MIDKITLKALIIGYVKYKAIKYYGSDNGFNQEAFIHSELKDYYSEDLDTLYNKYLEFITKEGEIMVEDILKRRLLLLKELCKMSIEGCQLYSSNDDFYKDADITLEDFINIIDGIHLDEYEYKIKKIDKLLKDKSI